MSLKTATSFLCCSLLCASAPLLADTVFMKSGQVFYNVVSVTNDTGYQLVFRNGATVRLRREDVARIQIQPVNWKPEKVMEYVEVPVPEKKADETKPRQEPNEQQYPWRHAVGLVPGAQQFRERRYYSAGIFAVASILAFDYLAVTNKNYEYAHLQYKLAIPLAAVYFYQSKEKESQTQENGLTDRNHGGEALIATYIPRLLVNVRQRKENLENAKLLAGALLVLNYLDATAVFGFPLIGAGRETPPVRMNFAFTPPVFLPGDRGIEAGARFQVTLRL